MIIDAHNHMITGNIIKKMGYKESQMSETLKEFSRHDVKENTDFWLSEMDKYEIDKCVFMANSSLDNDFIEFINSSTRFEGFCKINPIHSDSLDKLKKEIDVGMRGVKFYATSEGFDVSSLKCYPVYEYCEKNNIPIVIHFGVTIGRNSVLQMGNPLLLSKVLKDFSNLKFVIAHFGAGFFRETLMLKYKHPNLFVDTSGTNNWLNYQDNFMNLKDVFRKTIEVYGCEGIIYGSDTRIYPDGYRKNVLDIQTKILDELGLSSSDKENIMHNNSKRIFNI
ncbi:amidohydrolase family protein [Candidatus Pacearchaeota archaeon]|nr:amidohydrolase family protein [Candidatus Pacearchaeota archaeon]